MNLKIIGNIGCSIGRALDCCVLEEEEPQLIASGTIGYNQARMLLEAKLVELGDSQAEIYIPDNEVKFYEKDILKEFLHLDETDKITYVPQKMDCDDFARILFGKGVPLVWTLPHALNWFYDEKPSVWYVEPQTDKIARQLEGWQGDDIRFFLRV